MADGRERIHERDRDAEPDAGRGAMGRPDERGTEVRREAVEGSTREPEARRRPGLDPANAERERHKRMDDPGLAKEGTPRRSSTAHDRKLAPEELPDPTEGSQG